MSEIAGYGYHTAYLISKYSIEKKHTQSWHFQQAEVSNWKLNLKWASVMLPELNKSFKE